MRLLRLTREAQVRLCEPTCTILLFGSGKCVLTGCRDFVSCIRAIYDVLDLLRRHMHGVHFSVFFVFFVILQDWR